MPSVGEISTGIRLGQVVASVFFCFTTAGVVFGYAALKPVLLASGVYSSMCKDGEMACAASDTRMNLMFTLATVVTNGAALPIGSMLDRYGPRKIAIGGALVFALGNFFFGLQKVHGAFDTYIIGYVLLALGSPGIFLAQFHLSNAFPAYSGVILAALTGAFDASSVPYLVYREVFQRTGLSIRAFFWFYTIFPAIIIIQQLLIGPQTIYQRSPNPSKDVITAEEAEDPTLNIIAGQPGTVGRVQSPLMSPDRDLVTSGFSRLSYPVLMFEGDEEEEVKALDGGKGDPLVGAMFGKGIKEQLKSSWFWLIAMYLFVQMLRINWYLATVQSQLEFYTGDAKLADKLTKAFTVLLPMGGIVGIPFVGILLDNRPIFDSTLVLLICGASFGILTMLSSTVPQLIGIGVLVFLRPLFYTFVSDFVAKIFGFTTFGTVYGLAVTISGLLGLLLTPMDMLTKGPLKGNYDLINITLLVVGTLTNLGLAVKIWLWVRKGRIALE